MLFRLPVLALLASFAPPVAAKGPSGSASSPESDDVCEFDILLDLVECAGLSDALAGKTVFGPCNYAFVDFLEETGLTGELLCTDLLEDLTEILLYHVIDGEIFASDILESDKKRIRLETLQGSKVTVKRDKLTVNGIDIVAPDALEGDPVLHGIAGILIPPGFGESESSDSISDSSPDSVESISDESVDECEFDILLELVDCAGLSDALAGKTVFGPCDYAFVDFLEETGLTGELLCTDLLEDLTEILLYHVIDGEIFASDILESDKKRIRLETLQGRKVTVNRNKLTVNGIDIVAPDALLGDPVLHGIAGVLIPPGFGESESSESI